MPQPIRRWFPLSRPLLLALAVLLAALSVLYSALWMYDARLPNTQVELGFNNQHNESFEEKTHSIFIHDVVKGSPAEQAGLLAGDHIIGVNGRTLTTAEPYTEAYARGVPGDAVELTVARPGTVAPVTVHGIFRARPNVQLQEGLAKGTAQQLLASFPVLFLLVGLAVLFLKLEDPHAWLLALMFCAFAAAPDIQNPMILSHVARVFAFTYRAIFVGMLCALFYLFFAVFPVRSLLERRMPWLKWLGLTLGLATVWPGLGTGQPTYPNWLEGLAGTRTSQLLFQASRYVFLGLGIVSLAQNSLLNTVPVEARRKSRVILWGTIVGVLPVLLERSARDLTGLQLPYWPDTLAYLVLFLYPLSFAYAVVKHRVMEIPALLRRSARYVLVQKGFVFAIFLVAAIAISLFSHLFSQFVQTHASLGMALSASFGIFLVWASAPLVTKITVRIDRAFFRSAYDTRKILQELAEKTRTVSKSDEMAALLETHVREALHPKTLACFIEEDESWLNAAPGSLRQLPEAIAKDDPRVRNLVEKGKTWDLYLAGFVASTKFSTLTAMEAECVVPILGRDARLLGMLVMGQRLSEEPYSREDKQLLEFAAGQAGIALENILLAEKIAERMETDRRVAHEMDIAREVQARLFPQVRPPMDSLEYAGTCIQVKEVGGDYYDFLDMGPHRLGIVLADISGKGIAAALLMANLQANLRSQYAIALEDPGKLLRSVNRLFYENTPDDRYATLFYADYEEANKRLRYVNCGHNPPILLRADGEVDRLAATGTVLGLFEKWQCATRETALFRGDLLVIYSDGVTEAMNRDDEEFGEARFLESLRDNRSLAPAALLRKVVSVVQEFTGGRQTDDLTLVIARAS